MFSAGYTTEPMPLETPEQWEERWVFDITEYQPSDFYLCIQWNLVGYGWEEDDCGFERAPVRAWKQRHGLTRAQKRLIADIIDLWGVNSLRAKWNAAAAQRGREWLEQKDQVLSGPRVFKKAYPNAIKEAELPPVEPDFTKRRISEAASEASRTDLKWRMTQVLGRPLPHA